MCGGVNAYLKFVYLTLCSLKHRTSELLEIRLCGCGEMAHVVLFRLETLVIEMYDEIVLFSICALLLLSEMDIF